VRFSHSVSRPARAAREPFFPYTAITQPVRLQPDASLCRCCRLAFGPPAPHTYHTRDSTPSALRQSSFTHCRPGLEVLSGHPHGPSEHITCDIDQLLSASGYHVTLAGFRGHAHTCKAAGVSRGGSQTLHLHNHHQVTFYQQIHCAKATNSLRFQNSTTRQI
jgi:hypothetical protein